MKRSRKLAREAEQLRARVRELEGGDPASSVELPRPVYRTHVGVPTYGSAPAVCMLAFGSFIGNGVANGLVNNLGEIDGAYIDRARNDLVRQAMGNGSTHLMFVDQDMILPEGAINRLISHDADFVAGSYWGKDDFFTPVSFHLDPFRRIYELEECDVYPPGEKATLPEGILDCWCGKPDDHLHSIGGPGMGCTLLSVAMLNRVEEHYRTHACPCGSPYCTPDRWFSSMETGEDIHLAMRCDELGIPRLLDGFVNCGHVRNQIVTRQHYEWAKKNAPRCTSPTITRGGLSGTCGRVAFWHVGDDDEAEKATLCWEHRPQPPTRELRCECGSKGVVKVALLSGATSFTCRQCGTTWIQKEEVA